MKRCKDCKECLSFYESFTKKWWCSKMSDAFKMFIVDPEDRCWSND